MINMEIRYWNPELHQCVLDLNMTTFLRGRGVDRKQKEDCEHEAIVKVSEVFVLRISVSLNVKTYHNDHGNGYVNSYQQCQRKD